MQESLFQLREDFKAKVSKLNDYLWASGLKDPVSRVQQLSYLFFLKMLEEQDLSREQEAKLTGQKHTSIYKGENEKYRWSSWIHRSGRDLYNFLRDEVFPFMENLNTGHESAQLIFQSSRLLIPDEIVLRNVLDIVDGIRFTDLDADVKGDLYEDLLNQIQAAGELGQFRTPRHIIRTIVALVNPQVGQTIYDPAVGTGGFLLASYDWVRLQNSDQKNIKDENGIRRGPGDKLSPNQWEFLNSKTFYGQDVDPDMVRIAVMNLFLHGIENSNIKRKDTVAGSETEDDLRQFDIILTNPPFAGKIDKERIKKSLPVKSTDTTVLFLGHLIDSLKTNGKAGMIVNEGLLFGRNRDNVEIRKYLLDKTELKAVVSLPQGVFNPYAGVKTSFLIFENNGKKTEDVWFYEVENDGFSKGTQRKPIDKNDLPDLIEKWKDKSSSEKSWTAERKTIEENDYILSANTYKPAGAGSGENHRDPRVILKEIEGLDSDLSNQKKKLRKFL